MPRRRMVRRKMVVTVATLLCLDLKNEIAVVKQVTIPGKCRTARKLLEEADYQLNENEIRFKANAIKDLQIVHAAMALDEKFYVRACCTTPAGCCEYINDPKEDKK